MKRNINLNITFKEHAIKSKIHYLHCDNCRGQNRNSFIMWYMCLCSILGLNDYIECSVLIPYHTSFRLPNLITEAYVSSISQLGDVVSASVMKTINIRITAYKTQIPERLLKLLVTGKLTWIKKKSRKFPT